MPTASISGTVLNVTGLTVGQQYAMMLYCLYPGNTSYTALVRQPESGTREAATTTWSFNISSYVGNAGTYKFYVNVYAPGQSPQNTQTNIVSYTTQPPVTYTTVTGYCGTGMSSFRMSSSRGTYQTVTATSGGIQSMQVVSGDTVNFTQLNPLDGYGAPYSLYYNRSGQSGWFGPATTFDITDTSFDRRIMITATELTKPVAPTITSVETTKNSATIYWASNGGDGSTGYWTLFYRTATGAYVSYGNISSSPVTISGLSPGTAYYFKVRHTVNGSYLDSADASATTKELIASFAWTSNDGYYIAPGQPISYITANGWNTLRQRVADCGGTAASVPTATAGAALSTNHFNQMRAAIAALNGAGTVTPYVYTSQMPTYRAAQFANDSAALKEAINRAITAKNAS